MHFTIIDNEADYRLALNRINQLMASMPGTPEGDEFNQLVNVVEAYEESLLTKDFGSVE